MKHLYALILGLIFGVLIVFLLIYTEQISTVNQNQTIYETKTIDSLTCQIEHLEWSLKKQKERHKNNKTKRTKRNQNHERIKASINQLTTVDTLQTIIAKRYGKIDD